MKSILITAGMGAAILLIFLILSGIAIIIAGRCMKTSEELSNDR